MSARVATGFEADAGEAEAERARDLVHVAQVGGDLQPGCVQVLDRAAGELELPARLQADGTAVAHQADDVVAVVDGLPALGHDPFEQRADALVLVIRRGEIRAAEADLLVLGADAPFGFRLGARGEPVGKLTRGGDRRGISLAGIGHEGAFYSWRLALDVEREGDPSEPRDQRRLRAEDARPKRGERNKGTSGEIVKFGPVEAALGADRKPQGGVTP